MSTIQKDIYQIKKQSQNDHNLSLDQDEAKDRQKQEMQDKLERVEIENRVLQARLQEMESQVNSLSTNFNSRGRDS